MDFLSEPAVTTAFFGAPGPFELIIIAVVLLLMVGVFVGIVCLVIALSRRAGNAGPGDGGGASDRLMNCPDCGHVVSRRAQMCPNCGAPVQRPDDA